MSDLPEDGPNQEPINYPDVSTKRTPAEIRHNDIVNFIVGVRKLSSQTTNIERNVRQIKNMSNAIFRHYIGYTAKAEYRLKHKKDRTFADDVKRCGLEDPFSLAPNVFAPERNDK